MIRSFKRCAYTLCRSSNICTTPKSGEKMCCWDLGTFGIQYANKISMKLILEKKNISFPEATKPLLFSYLEFIFNQKEVIGSIVGRCNVVVGTLNLSEFIIYCLK